MIAGVSRSYKPISIVSNAEDFRVPARRRAAGICPAGLRCAQAMNGDWLESHAAPDVPQAASIDDVKPSARSTSIYKIDGPYKPDMK